MKPIIPKYKRIEIIRYIVGNDIEFIEDHKILNGSIVFVGIIFLITFTTNLSSFLAEHLVELSYPAAIITGTTASVFIILYYMSRIKKLYSVSLYGFYFAVFSSLIFSWFYAGGIISTVPLYYLSLICYIIFFSKGRLRIILVLIYLVNLVILSIFELYYPDLIAQYPNRDAQIPYMIKAFIMSAFLNIYIVYSGQKLYLKEKKTNTDLINQYRISSETLKKQFKSKFELLSLREREIFSLIIEGKSNTEIAKILFIGVGTVKNHVHNIYKKLETSSRKETINFAAKHE